MTYNCIFLWREGGKVCVMTLLHTQSLVSPTATPRPWYPPASEPFNLTPVAPSTFARLSTRPSPSSQLFFRSFSSSCDMVVGVGWINAVTFQLWIRLLLPPVLAIMTTTQAPPCSVCNTDTTSWLTWALAMHKPVHESQTSVELCHYVTVGPTTFFLSFLRRKSFPLLAWLLTRTTTYLLFFFAPRVSASWSGVAISFRFNGDACGGGVIKSLATSGGSAGEQTGCRRAMVVQKRLAREEKKSRHKMQY